MVLYTISKTKKTRKVLKSAKKRQSRRSTPPFSPLLGLLGGAENATAAAAAAETASPNSEPWLTLFFDAIGELEAIENKTEAQTNVWNAINSIPCIKDALKEKKAIECANAEDVPEVIQTVLNQLRGVIDDKDRKIKQIEQALDIIYIKEFKADYLLDVSKLFYKKPNSEKIAVIQNVLSCVIFGIRNPDKKDEVPVDLSEEYNNLATGEAILEGLNPRTEGTEYEKLNVAQQLLASAMWVKLLRTLDDNLNQSQRNGSNSGSNNYSNSNTASTIANAGTINNL